VEQYEGVLRLSDQQVWSLEEFARNGPGFGRELMEERGHHVYTLDSFVARGYIESQGEGGAGLDLTKEGREALASVPVERLGKPNPRKRKPKKR